MTTPSFPPLPIDPVLPDLLQTLAEGSVAVLQAPPGAGKTTRVPLALLEQSWVAGKRIIVLEPRRIAARAAAHRMAALLGEGVGETVGYRVRLDQRVGPRTRIEVVTEGVFLRQLQREPGLESVAAVLFDEFHERNLDSDLALALCRETQTVLREDLRLMAMSATLDAAPVAALLGNAPLVTSAGRAFPVEIRYLDLVSPVARIEDLVVDAVHRALREQSGSLLVFLPGGREIRRVERMLGEGPLSGAMSGKVVVTPLYGDLPSEQQDAAIRPAGPGIRKIVLATPIAETSLTIEGIRVVIDSGLMRVPRFDARSGMTRLETIKVSQASAEQRRGRAGRLEPGICYRLWPESTHRALAPFNIPEIMAADLAPLALELAAWGVREPQALVWLDPPPSAHFAQARALLAQLGAVEPVGASGGSSITAHGRAMADLGMHPRLAHMVLTGRRLGLGGLACEIAALLGERDLAAAAAPGSGRDADLRLRLQILHARRIGAAIREQARLWQRQLGTGPAHDDEIGRCGTLVALAYPDRIAQRRAGTAATGSFRLSNGRGAVLAATDPLAASDWLAVADLDGAPQNARIFLAAPLAQAEIEALFETEIRTETVIAWDEREEAVLARRRRRLFELILKDEALNDVAEEQVTAVLLDVVARKGLDWLPWTATLRVWQARVALLRRLDGADAWPDVSDVALAVSVPAWLGPFATGLTRRSHLKRLDLAAALATMLDGSQRQALEREAPVHVTVPSGSRVPIDYLSAEEPILAVRLQELFGLAQTPRIAGGRVPLLLHLLSPARRPVQVTRDLASFWNQGYKAVRADLRGRYPRHYWPDDPLQAEPTARVRRRPPS
ncbi:MAG: ATP-dependent helicase HrpB [Azospirillaceae bacterium]|nr:ATP-dependent helicase HrpB [Azospirillaceae bacterium]